MKEIGGDHGNIDGSPLFLHLVCQLEPVAEEILLHFIIDGRVIVAEMVESYAIENSQLFLVDWEYG
jgi:hypothetical protein